SKVYRARSSRDVGRKSRLHRHTAQVGRRKGQGSRNQYPKLSGSFRTAFNRLTSYGVGYRSFTEQYFDSCGIFRDAVIAIIATVAKQERVRLSQRVKAGLETPRARQADRSPSDSGGSFYDRYAASARVFVAANRVGVGHRGGHGVPHWSEPFPKSSDSVENVWPFAHRKRAFTTSLPAKNAIYEIKLNELCMEGPHTQVTVDPIDLIVSRRVHDKNSDCFQRLADFHVGDQKLCRQQAAHSYLRRVSFASELREPESDPVFMDGDTFETGVHCESHWRALHLYRHDEAAGVSRFLYLC